jgi:hypothetical protein
MNMVFSCSDHINLYESRMSAHTPDQASASDILK